MQLLELWQMAKLVLKQIIKAHGPLVDVFRTLWGFAVWLVGRYWYFNPVQSTYHYMSLEGIEYAE